MKNRKKKERKIHSWQKHWPTPENQNSVLYSKVQLLNKMRQKNNITEKEKWVHSSNFSYIKKH